MANPHCANLGDVWKHLLLTEVISSLRPGHYVETHAGSASYRLVCDVERGLGVEMFFRASADNRAVAQQPLPAAHPGLRSRRRAVVPGFAAAGDDAAWPRVPICLL